MRQPREIVATHLPQLHERSRATVERLIDLILDAIPDAQHDWKWSRLTFTREGDRHHWICAVSLSRNAVKLVIHKGSLLDDSHRVMKGDARYSRNIAFRSPEQ